MTIRGSCHCGDIAFEIDGEIPEQLTRCTCSFCAKRGHLYAYYTPSEFRQTKVEVRTIFTDGTRKPWRITPVRVAAAGHSQIARLFDPMAAGTASRDVLASMQDCLTTSMPQQQRSQ